MNEQVYFETLAGALNAFVAKVLAKGGEFASSDIASAFDGGVSYGQTVSRSFELASLKRKKTKKYAHVTLYRMESGKYELTSYIL